MKRLPKNSGQALLVVLLIMAVALTVGLAVTSRTVTDIEISEQTEEAARAFSAAEAGIEEALVGIGTTFGGGWTEEGVSYSSTKTSLGKDANEYLFPEASQEDEVRTLWLADYDDLSKKYDYNQLQIFWANSGTTPALEVTIYYQTGSDYKIIRYALDPLDPFARSSDPDNKFCRPDGTNCVGIFKEGVGNPLGFDQGSFSIVGKNVRYKAILDLSAASSGKLLFARFRFLYLSSGQTQALGVKVAGSGTGLGNFPSQGVKIESTGQAGTSTRKVEVVRMHPAPPGIFDFLLYSESDLVK